MSWSADLATPDEKARTAGAAGDAEACAARLAELDPSAFSAATVQRLMATAVRAYGRLLDEGTAAPAFGSATEVTATDAVRAASAVLKGVNLEVFELALWETWGGAPWTGQQGGTDE